MKKKLLLYLLCGTLTTSIFSLTPLTSMQMVSYAHSGRTDSSGGHRDNKNKSGLGSYHYHCGGYGPHLHSGGVCPYGGDSSSTSDTSQSTNTSTGTKAANENKPEPAKYGWKQNNYGWYYQTSETAYCQNCFADIDGKIYYFNNDGMMSTGWKNMDGGWYYFNADGSMVTGWQYIDLLWYYFDSNGRMMTDWQTIGEEVYYFYPDGHMATEIADIDGETYYFNDDGSLDEEWE